MLEEKSLEHKPRRFENGLWIDGRFPLRDVLEREKLLCHICVESHIFLSFLIDFSFFFSHANQAELMNAIDPVARGCAWMNVRCCQTVSRTSPLSLFDRLDIVNRKDINVSDKRSLHNSNPTIQRGICICLPLHSRNYKNKFLQICKFSPSASMIFICSLSCFLV